jgi:hypothetical protein
VDFVTIQPVYVSKKQVFYAVVLVVRTEGFQDCGEKKCGARRAVKKFLPASIFLRFSLAHGFSLR